MRSITVFATDHIFAAEPAHHSSKDLTEVPGLVDEVVATVKVSRHGSL